MISRTPLALNSVHVILTIGRLYLGNLQSPHLTKPFLLRYLETVEILCLIFATKNTFALIYVCNGLNVDQVFYPFRRHP